MFMRPKDIYRVIGLGSGVLHWQLTCFDKSVKVSRVRNQPYGPHDLQVPIDFAFRVRALKSEIVVPVPSSVLWVESDSFKGASPLSSASHAAYVRLSMTFA